jgi:hypothetical protein
MMASNMTDDSKYVALMARYKELRGREGEAAVRYLEAAMKLREQGNVSKDAIIGGAYL